MHHPPSNGHAPDRQATNTSNNKPRKEHAHDTRAGRRRRTQIGGQFSAHLIEMIRSPAWCVLSLSARRVLDRIEIEHADHGGTDNGKLSITFDDFVSYGLHRHAIAPAIREVVMLGFLEVTEAGRAGNAAWRKPSRYRLTYRHTNDAAATDDWKKIRSKEDAAAIADMARKAFRQKQNTSDGKRTDTSDGKRTTTPLFPVTETITTAMVRKPSLPSISRERSRRSRSFNGASRPASMPRAGS
ncbi:MAG: hypothetical protein ACLP19_28450 [Xanthobacteraceae bacterium]